MLVIPVANLNGVSNLSAIFMFSTMEVSFKSLPILGIVFDILKYGLFTSIMRANLTEFARYMACLRSIPLEYHIVLVGTQMVIELISTVTFTFKHTACQKELL